MRQAAQSLGLKKANPTVYGAVMELTRPRAAGQAEGPVTIDFDQFLNALMNHLGDTQSAEGARRIFEVFVEEDSKVITMHSLRGVARELGEEMSADEIQQMLQRAASNGEEITL